MVALVAERPRVRSKRIDRLGRLTLSTTINRHPPTENYGTPWQLTYMPAEIKSGFFLRHAIQPGRVSSLYELMTSFKGHPTTSILDYNGNQGTFLLLLHVTRNDPAPNLVV